MRFACLCGFLLLALPGCASTRGTVAPTTSELALERVVLYRNGVGYFERRGDLDEDVLRIKVRRDQVDDLLKSLTVVDRGSGHAVSISIPLDPQAWSSVAAAVLGPGEGELATVLDGLRGTPVAVSAGTKRIEGRIVMVEELPLATPPEGELEVEAAPPRRDHRLTLLAGQRLSTVRLSEIEHITLREGDLAMQLHRRLDASAGEGMFEQVEVAVRLAGARAHRLAVSYVVAAPLWKPTYRVVLPEGGKGEALLQGWAVVDNVSGEDWNEVALSLTAGEPIAFRYDLHTPREVPRADLTEVGVRRRAAVAVGETSWADGGAEAPPAPPSAATADADYGGEGEDEAQAAEESFMEAPTAKRLSSRGAAGGAEPKPAPAEPPPQPAVDAQALARSTQASARAKSVSGLSTFELADRVTVPSGTSTMVALLNEQVQAEETFLFRPGGAGTGFDANPYRVVRFHNDTPFALEPGPISIYAGGSFVGEGLSEIVGANASATIPFAVEPSILVSSSTERTGDELRLLRISGGVLETESFSRITTTWTVQGQSRDRAYTVWVRHDKAGPDYALVEPPKRAETLPDAYLLPVDVPNGQSSAKLTVVERTPARTTLSIWDSRAPVLLEQLLVATDLSPEQRAKLEPIVRLRQAIARIDTEVDGLTRQQSELDARAEQTRRNLEAIKKDPAATDLRRKLGARLDEFTREADAIGRRLVELQSQRLEHKIELEDLLQGLELRR